MSTGELYARAMQLLGLSHPGAAELLGISERSSQRWVRGGAYLSPRQFSLLAVKVHPLDPALAAEFAYRARTTLEALGLVAPPAAPAPAPPPAPRFATEDVIDSIVCAAAEAMGAMPAAVRPALLAAFRRARRLQLDVATVEAALEPTVTPR